MANIIKTWFDGARRFGRGWPCRLFGGGVMCLLLAVMLGTCVISIEGESRSVGDDLHSLPNYDYLGEVVKLKEASKDEAKELARYIIETEGMPNQDAARRIYDEIVKDQRNWWSRTKRAVCASVRGEGESLEELGGRVVSDIVFYENVWDLINYPWYVLSKNEKCDYFIIMLAACGSVDEFVDEVDWVPAVLKAFRKIGALSEKMIGLLSGGMMRVVETRKVDSELKSLFSGIRSMTGCLGFARASQVMRHVDTAAEVAALAKAAKVVPNETYLMVKYSGRAGIENLEGLSDEQYKILREVAKKGPDALKNVKKYLNAVKSKTTNVRRISRLLKSIQSGHLTGFVHKLALASPISVVCAMPLFAQTVNTTYYNPNGSYGGSARTTQNGNAAQTTFYNQNESYGGSAQTYGNGNGAQTTFYNQNGSYGGSAQTFQSGNTANTTYYNSNGSYGGSSRTTTFGNQSTTYHYGANGAPVGSSTTTTFGNQTTTTHYNQYGQPAGTMTQYGNFGQSR